jgi:nucleoside-diphosphate-sugar epimerase
MVIDRVPPPERLPNVEFEWADLRHLDQIYEADYLIHLAAITNAGYAERHPLDTYEVNLLGTVNLLNHVKIRKRVLFPSTALVYKASELPLNEDAERELSATYAQSKNLGEQVVKSHSKILQRIRPRPTPFVHSRPGSTSDRRRASGGVA